MAGRENPNTLTLSRYTQEAKAHVSAAQAIADERKHPEVLPLHLLVRLLERASAVVDVLRDAEEWSEDHSGAQIPKDVP